MANPVLHVENLTKRYGDVEAVRGISFAVAEGEVFGLLGPNGAGKTSTVEILEGLRNADSGTRVRLRSTAQSRRTEARNRRSAPIYRSAGQIACHGSAETFRRILQAAA